MSTSRKHSTELVVDECEAAAIARIEVLHRSASSLRQIAAILTDEGYRPKRSTRWHPQVLSRLVCRIDDAA